MSATLPPRNVPVFDTSAKPGVLLEFCEGSKRSLTGADWAKMRRGAITVRAEADHAALQLRRCGKRSALGAWRFHLSFYRGSDSTAQLVAVQRVVAVSQRQSKKGAITCNDRERFVRRSRIELPGMARATAPQQRGGEAKRLPRKRVRPASCIDRYARRTNRR